MTQDGPCPPVTGPGPSIATAPCSDAAVTPPRTSSPPLRGHAVSPAPGSEMMAAVFEMFRQQQEQQQEMLRRQHEHNCDREDKREKARARERAEDRERQEQQREMLRCQHEHDREQRDHDRQLDRERAVEHDRLLSETSTGLQQLRRDMANSPRFSHRGTPTGTPVPAVDDRPKPAPHKTPTKVDPTAPYQAADRHPGYAESTPPPTTCQCTQNARVPALHLLIPQPPTQPSGVAWQNLSDPLGHHHTPHVRLHPHAPHPHLSPLLLLRHPPPHSVAPQT